MTIPSESVSGTGVLPMDRRASGVPGVKPAVSLLGLGVATPGLTRTQQDLGTALETAWGLDSTSAERWWRIVNGSGIESRSGVVMPERIMDLSTAQRMAEYVRLAPGLAREAAERAIGDAGVDRSRITDLIIVTCTGFSSPGVDVALAAELGLSPNVRRSQVGFMGCFGGILGLRTGAGMCALDPVGVTLVVCVELCSLHIRPSHDVENLVSAALFADGAAAVVLCGAAFEGDRGDASGLVRPGMTCLLPGTDAQMTWTITDEGFAMTLDRKVPRHLGENLDHFLDQLGPVDSVLSHPGGAGILDAIDEVIESRDLPCQSTASSASRSVLSKHGNMSSCTILFVLQQYLLNGGHVPAGLIAFGPGLTMDAVIIDPVDS